MVLSDLKQLDWENSMKKENLKKPLKREIEGNKHRVWVTWGMIALMAAWMAIGR